LLKIIENGAVPYTTYDFLLVYHCNCSSVLYRYHSIAWMRLPIHLP